MEIIKWNFFFQYRANAITEISKLLAGKSELTLAAILKLIDEDFLPKANTEWALNITINMKKYLTVSSQLIKNIDYNFDIYKIYNRVKF